MTRWRWIWQQSRSSVLLTLALAGLGVAAVLHATVIAPARAQIAALEREAHAAERQARRVRSETPEQQLETFYAQFPSSNVVPSHLSKLFTLAQTHGLTLRQGEYRLTRDRDARLARYQIVLPVQGPYVKVRRFASAALFAMPTAALDQISYERKRIGDGQVDAQLRFTLYLLEP